MYGLAARIWPSGKALCATFAYGTITVAAGDEDCLVGTQILHAGQLVGAVQSAHVACDANSRSVLESGRSPARAVQCRLDR